MNVIEEYKGLSMNTQLLYNLIEELETRAKHPILTTIELELIILALRELITLRNEAAQ